MFFFIYFFSSSSISLLYFVCFCFIYYPYSAAHGMASCAPRIIVFEKILLISFKKFKLSKKYHFTIVLGKFLCVPFSFCLFLLYCQFFVCFFLSLFFVMSVFGPFMCPYSGEHGTLSCAPRISVFEKILILLNNFK